MRRRGWKILSATYRTKLDSLGRQASNRNQIPAYSMGVPADRPAHAARRAARLWTVRGGACHTIGP